MRYADKCDSSESAIITALVSCGCSVWQRLLPCDLLVYRAGRFYTLVSGGSGGYSTERRI